MIISKIPKSVQEILDNFIQLNFPRYSYNYLAEKLGLKIDTLIQRISRNKEYFEIDDSQRPSRISVKKGIKEIYFYRDKNICQLCQKILNPEKLILKFRNPFQDDKYRWRNVLSVCDECKDKEIIKIVKQVKQLGAYEYKEVYITSVSRKIKDEWESYYEFDEHDGRGFFPLIGENEKIASRTVGDILNYFSADGWKVVHIESIRGEHDEVDDYQVFFERKRKES